MTKPGDAALANQSTQIHPYVEDAIERMRDSLGIEDKRGTSYFALWEALVKRRRMSPSDIAGEMVFCDRFNWNTHSFSNAACCIKF